MAIMYSTVLPVKYWEPKDLEEILRISDRLYRRINSPHHYLLVSDIPDVVRELENNIARKEMVKCLGQLVDLCLMGLDKD